MKISEIYAPISVGELFDKMTILLIKKEKIKNKDKLDSIDVEFQKISPIFDMVVEQGMAEDAAETKRLFDKLKKVNELIWSYVGIMSGHAKDLDNDVEMHHSIIYEVYDLGVGIFYRNNERFEAKRAIDEFFGSEITEEKECI